MKTLRLQSLFIAALFCISACSGNNDSSGKDGDEAITLADSADCQAPAFDVAELLFTESDRQWYCSVSTAGFNTEDEIYFKRDGRAEISRFGEVYWNRSLADDSIRIASPSIADVVLRQITSSNTVLRFELVVETGLVEIYDCVLIARELQLSGLL